MNEYNRQFTEGDVLTAQVKNARQEAACWKKRYDELKAELIENNVVTVRD